MVATNDHWIFFQNLLAEFIEFVFSVLFFFLEVLAAKVCLHIREVHLFIVFEKFTFSVVPALECLLVALRNGLGFTFFYCAF